MSTNSSRPSGHCTMPLRAMVPAEWRALAADLARIGQKAGDGIEQRGLAGAVQSDHRDEFAGMDMDRDVVERLRLAVMHADVLDFEERRRGVAERGFRARRGLDAAAEIDAAHGVVAHHLVGTAFGD